MNSNQDPKVNAILECIASGDLRKAMKKVNSQIQNNELSKFYALKALVYQKLKKVPECMEIVKRLQTTSPDDIDSIEILIVIFKNLKKLDEVTELYEEAYEKFPSEDRGKNLYQAYSSQFKFGEQSKIALKLHKYHGNVEYAEWGAFSMLLLADTDSRQVGMVEIADLLFQKIKRRDGFAYTPTFFRLDIAIHERLKAFSEAIHLLNQHIDIISDYVERTSLIAKFYRLRGEHIHTLNLYHSILSLNQSETTARDLWQISIDYIDTIFEIVKLSCEGTTRFSQLGPFDPTSVVIKAVDTGTKHNIWKPLTGTESLVGIIIASLANIRAARDLIQGRGALIDLIKRQSYLLEMEFKRRLIFWNFSQGAEEYKDEAEPGGIFMPLILRYISLYYEIPTTPDEMTPFLYHLNATQLIPFKDKIQAFLDKTLDLNTNKIKCLKCTICCVKILRLVGCYSPPVIKTAGNMWEAAGFLIRKYLEYVEYEPNPKKNEIRLSDDLLLLAVEVLLQSIPEVTENTVDYNTISTNEEPFPSFSHRIFFCIGVLEYGMHRSPYNKTFKFKLMALYEKIKNYIAVAKIYNSLEVKDEQVETQSYIYYRMLIESPIHIKELQELSKNISHYHKTANYELLPYIHRAYSKYSIEEVKSLFDKKVTIENSYFKTIAQFITAYTGIFKTLLVPGQYFAKYLRENLALFNKTSTLSDISEFSQTADMVPLYDIGVIKIKPIRDIKAKIPYQPEALKEDPFKHRKLSPDSAYGLYLDNRIIHIHSMKLKLILDIVEQNIPGIESGLRALNSVLSQLDLLSKPALKKAINWRPGSSAAFDEAVPDKPFTGKFESEAEFINHKKLLDSKIWKFLLMIFEGAFRLICAHPSDNYSRTRSPTSRENNEYAEQDFTYKLTAFPHVSRHAEVLNLMLKDIESLIIPKEDYLKKLKLGLSKISSSLDADVGNEDNAENDDIMHPGMIYIINDVLHGPLLTVKMLMPSLISTLPSKQLPNDPHPDLNHVLNIHKCIEQLGTETNALLSKIKDYLDQQTRMSYWEQLGNTYLSTTGFQQYTSMLPPDTFRKILQNISTNHLEELKTTIEFISLLENIPN
ncbi:unnamed protein product [Blepharisma stoltei]|uniref:Uncharacterized protein n=1 Tax=Blepharisma stoltei TaxID=1481888 RepID=A0AAU9KB11_9CILI|nr:unnamed protein product [Blepharisma stoltei]